ncbi:MAG: PBP1A family penicillin-binding protein [Caldithrix sp.]|nr:PBP1A family penicillin-binding protein [Caldithrix sp.]
MKRKKRNTTKHNFTKFVRTPTKTTHNTQPLTENGQPLYKKFWFYATLLILLIAIGGGFYFYQLTKELPPLTKLERIDPAVASQVFTADGQLLHSFFRLENRKYLQFDRIPNSAVNALISSEDREFFNHWGINLYGIVRAFLVNITNMRIEEGASTISMQLARNLYFGYRQTLERKLKEAMTAIQIERTYSKKEILEMYLNVNSFGSNAFGIKSAARRFFDKPAEDLTVEESALLIGILNGPSYYSPIRHPERAQNRRNLVMRMMVDHGTLSRSKYDSLKQLPLNLKLNDPHEMKMAPYFTEYVRRQLNKMQDSLNVDIYEDGLRIYTSLNTEVQNYMEEAVSKNIEAIQARVRQQRTFREMRKEMPDSVVDELSFMQIAFVAINPHNGHIMAMIGGRDFEKSKWNRVTQMERQPGSAFKPFLYTAAIDNGYSPADEYLNQPTVEINPDGTRWTPKNYKGDVGGWMTLRDALRNSVNLVAVRLISDISPRVVANYAREMGISTEMRPFSSLALGSSEVIPLELVSAYGTFANNGVHVEPVSILKIEDKNGNVIYQAQPQREEVLSPSTTYIMNDMLQDVINRGTGYGVRRDYKFYHEAGGKTGTTNDNTNAWFIGFTPDFVAGVWVGIDDFQYNLGPGMAGAVAALPFWADFMSTVYDSLQFRQREFPKASGVIELEICQKSKKLATPYCLDTYKEIFKVQYQPEEKCDIHKGRQSIDQNRRRRF